MIPAGIAAHAGSPRHAPAEPPEPPEKRDLAAAVAQAEPHQDDGDEPGGAGRDRDLIQGGAAGGFRGEKDRPWANVSSFDVTFCDVTPHGRYPRIAWRLTIDELARETGLTVRNVRSHHARGLLPPPEVRGRTGFYGPEHVERLRLIQELQSEGLKLEGIKRLLGDYGERLLALKRAAGEAPETPEVVTAQELGERLRLASDDDPRKLLAKAIKLGVLVPLGEGHFEVPSPALLAGRRGGRRARRQPRPRARHDRAASSATRARSRRSSSSCSWTTSGSRSPTPACRGEVGRADRVGRARAPARRPGAARRLPPHDGRGGRGDLHRPRTPPGQKQDDK